MAATAQSVIGVSQGRVLIASGNPEFRRQMAKQSTGSLAQTEEAEGGAHALAKLLQCPCDGVLLDRNLPDLDAEEVAEMIRQQYPRIEVKFVDSRMAETEGNEVEQGTSGASEKVVDEEEVKSDETWEALPGMIGQSEAIRKTYQLAKLVAGRDTTVLVTGETGTGKELVGQGIHALSPRAKQAFVAVNCAAIPEALPRRLSFCRDSRHQPALCAQSEHACGHIQRQRELNHCPTFKRKLHR